MTYAGAVQQLKSYIDMKLCAISKALSIKVSQALAIDPTAPQVSRAQLQASSSQPKSAIYLTDGVYPRNMAFLHAPDTTTPPSANVIVDAIGRRWFVESTYSFLEKLNPLINS